jgi:hypothetical protein
MLYRSFYAAFERLMAVKNPRVTVVLPPSLKLLCENDASEQHLSLSEYLRRLAEERHGFVKLLTPPPKVTALPMQAKARTGSII